MGIVQSMQAGDEGITLLGVLIEGLGRNGLDRGQGILDTMFHLVHKQLLLLVSVLSLSDVSGNFGGADDPSIGILDRRYCQRNIDQTSVLVATDGIVMINALAPPYAVKESLDARNHLLGVPLVVILLLYLIF